MFYDFDKPCYETSTRCFADLSLPNQRYLEIYCDKLFIKLRIFIVYNFF